MKRRGRPPKYATEEERKAAIKRQHREARVRFCQRHPEKVSQWNEAYRKRKKEEALASSAPQLHKGDHDQEPGEAHGQ